MGRNRAKRGHGNLFYEHLPRGPRAPADAHKYTYTCTFYKFFICLKGCPESGGGVEKKHEILITRALMVPTWTKIGVPCTIFRKESEYDTPGVYFLETSTKNEKQIVEL